MAGTLRGLDLAASKSHRFEDLLTLESGFDVGLARAYLPRLILSLIMFCHTP